MNERLSNLTEETSIVQQENGAPKSAEESILLAHLTEVNQIGSDIHQFEATNQVERKRLVQRNRFNTFLSDPQAMERYFDTINLIETRDGENNHVQRFKDDFLENIDRFLVRPKQITPRLIRRWLKLYHSSDLYRPIAEKVLRCWNSDQNPEGAVKFFYKFAQAVLDAEDESTFLAGMGALLGEGELLFAEQRDFDNFLTAAFGNDESLSKFLQIDEVITYLGPKYQHDLHEKWLQKLRIMEGRKKFPEAAFRIFDRDPARAKKIVDFVDPEGGKPSIPPGKENEWPYVLRLEPGLLRLSLHKARESLEGYASFVLPSGKAILEQPDLPRIRKIIIDDLESRQALPQEERIVRDAFVVTSAFYLMPNEAEPRLGELMLENARLREEILKEQEHSVSPRGDRILIMNPILKDLGFESITFRFAAKKPRLIAEAMIRKHAFQVELNEGLALEEVATGGRFLTFFERMAFFEHIFLTHLRELVCGNRVVPGLENEKGEARVEREKEFLGRRGHRRLLLPGKKISLNAIALALEEQGWDMVRFNAERTASNKPAKTYVKITEVSTGTEPIISRAPHAMDRFKEIIERTT